MRPLLALALALLFVTAGCSGFGGTRDDSATVAPELRDTPTPTDVPTTAPVSESPLPPGVTPGADDEVDERALYVAHDRVLENRSVTWRSQQIWTDTNGTVLRLDTLTVWTNGSRQRYEAESGGADPTAARRPGTEYEYWTNGSVTVTRQMLADGSVERRIIDGGPPGSYANVEAGRVVLESFLVGTDLQYVGVERRNGTTRHVLAGTADDGRLTLRVTSGGVVRSLVSRTRTRVREVDVTVVRRFRTYDAGTTTVERPAWAENGTGRRSRYHPPPRIRADPQPLNTQSI